MLLFLVELVDRTSECVVRCGLNFPLCLLYIIMPGKSSPLTPFPYPSEYCHDTSSLLFNVHHGCPLCGSSNLDMSAKKNHRTKALVQARLPKRTQEVSKSLKGHVEWLCEAPGLVLFPDKKENTFVF